MQIVIHGLKTKLAKYMNTTFPKVAIFCEIAQESCMNKLVLLTEKKSKEEHIRTRK